jgi:hypothetical protein
VKALSIPPRLPAVCSGPCPVVLESVFRHYVSVFRALKTGGAGVWGRCRRKIPSSDWMCIPKRAGVLLIRQIISEFFYFLCLDSYALCHMPYYNTDFEMSIFHYIVYYRQDETSAESRMDKRDQVIQFRSDFKLIDSNLYWCIIDFPFVGHQTHFKKIENQIYRYFLPSLPGFQYFDSRDYGRFASSFCSRQGCGSCLGFRLCFLHSPGVVRRRIRRREEELLYGWSDSAGWESRSRC